MDATIVPPASSSSHHPSPEAELRTSAEAAFPQSAEAELRPPHIKQEPVSRENSPLARDHDHTHHHPSLAPFSRHPTPLVQPSAEMEASVEAVARPEAPLPPTATEAEIPCSQESASTAPVLDDPDTPVKTKVEDEDDAPFTVGGAALIQESPSANQSSRRKRGKRRKSGKPGVEQPTLPAVPVRSSSTQIRPRIKRNMKSKTMRLTDANKGWLDRFTPKESADDSIDTTSATNDHSSHLAATDLPPSPPAPPTRHFDNMPRYIKQILSRSLSWSLLPLRWTAHWAAMYILPLAIAIALFSFLFYILIPKSIFSALPSVLSTTTTMLAFPAKLVVSKGPALWCGYVGLGCRRDEAEHEENFRNATFATDLEVRNAHTVITNLNQLNGSSLRLSLDSVQPPPFKHMSAYHLTFRDR